MKKSIVLQHYINKLVKHENLSFDESAICGRELLNSANEVQIAGFLALLTAKGETVDELVGLVTAIREHAVKLAIDYPTLDIVGTGGDSASTLNISTASSLLAASSGIPVLKHGNRAVSSRSGAADVLEVLGYPINLSPEEIKEALQKDNFAFCFAPNYHPLLAHVRDIRKNLGFATVFNLLGPLLNPVGLDYMLIGVYDKNKLKLIADALCKLGTKCSVVFHGNGLDELTCIGKIDAYLIKDNKVTSFEIDPEEYGLEKCTLEDLHGEDALYNSRVIEQTLSGVKTGLTDTLLLNVAVALFVFGKVANIKDGVVMARKRLGKDDIIRHNRLNEIIKRKQIPDLSKDAQEKLDLVVKQLANPQISPKLNFTKRKSFKQLLLSKEKGAVISEIKRASPSAGKIADIGNPVERAIQYVSLGAAGVSVLTDEGFEGSIQDLIEVAAALKDTPAAILRKEFILYPEQVIESRECGADAILLMVSVLGEKTKYFVDLAHAFGLETLVEVHAMHELQTAIDSGSDVIGVNQRDLRDFTMHPEVFAQMLDKLPVDMARVGESGIKTSADAKKIFALGYDAVLVGEALSRLANPADFFNELYSK
ncbi:MAG: trpD [Burkholderiales bacterium]|jgi:anthranilate phosphoribosyltransferase|nr:trpD [Burkholderiales bacterium]